MACGYWIQAAVEKCLFTRYWNLKVLQLRFWVLPVPLSRRLHRSRPCILGTLGRAHKVLRHVALRVTPTIVDDESTNFLKHCFVVSCLFVQTRASNLAVASSSEASICLCGDSFPCQVGLVNGNPSGSRSKIRSRKPLWNSGSSSAMYLLKDQALPRFPWSITQIIVNTSLWLPGLRSIPLRYLGRPRSLKIKLEFWERIEAPLPPLRPRPQCDFIHPRQAVWTERLPFPQNLRVSSWSCDMEGHAKKCVERYCELANKTTQQLYKVSTPCIDDHHFKEEELKSVGERSKVCSQFVLKCLYLARIGRPIFYVQWTYLHDRSRNGPKFVKNDYLVWSLTFFRHAITNNIVMWETRPNNADWDCFKIPILQEILWIQNLHQVEHCAFLEVIRLFQ